MFCTNCGAQIPDGAMFCTNCGASVGASERGRRTAGSATPDPDATVMAPRPQPDPLDDQADPFEGPGWADEEYFVPQSPAPGASPRAVAPAPAVPRGRAEAQAAASGSGGGMTVLAVVLAILAVCAVVACAGVMTGWFGLATPAGEQVVADEGESAGDEGDPAPAPGGQGEKDERPEVRSAVADYSWEELSRDSALLSAPGDGAATLEVAKEYHLCTADGRLDGTQTKSLTLTDGTTVSMQVAGFNHDDRADGTGTAGITFVSRGTVGMRQMNSSDTTVGGWRDSGLRSWMNTELLGRLPSEVSDVVVPVSKLTNSVGETTDVSAVVATSDTLWTLSYSEIGGQMSTDDPGHDAVYNAEGAQYQLFSDLGVRWDSPNQILQIGGVERWWEPSPDPLDGRYFMCVGDDGTPWYAHLPTKECGVVMCFCV